MKTFVLSIKIILILALLAALGTGAYIYSGAKDIAADTEHHPIEHWLLRTVRRHSMARRVDQVVNRMPSALTEEQLHASVIGYESMCAGCHTPPGRTDSALARGLNPPPPDMTRAAGRYPPEKLFWVTKHGVRMTGMPAWGITHSDEDLWQLVAFISRFPEMGAEGYERLLTDAQAAGVEHSHDPTDDDSGHPHHHDH